MRQGDSPAAPGLSNEATTILRTLRTLVEPLAQLLPGDCEVALHDLSRLPNSIVAIAGDLTGRKIGDPATDLLLRMAQKGDYKTALGYGSRKPDGGVLSSSTIIFNATDGTAVAAMCINCDTWMWQLVAETARKMLPPESGIPDTEEEFARDVDELASQLLSQAIAASTVPVDLMKKSHKILLVRDLRDRGFFTLRKAAETAAEALGVSRFTIYNYLNELERQETESRMSKATRGE